MMGAKTQKSAQKLWFHAAPVDYSPQNEASSLKEQRVCKVKCSHTTKCQPPGYQRPRAETVAEPIFPYSFTPQTNVVSFYHKELLLWRSRWAPTAPERDIFSTNRIRAKCRCWIVFSFYSPYTTWPFFFGVGFFVRLVLETTKFGWVCTQKGRLHLWHKEMPNVKSSLLYRQGITTLHKTV